MGFIDYYKVLGIDRNLDCKEIRKYLGAEQKKWMTRQSSTNDPEMKLVVKEHVDRIAEAMAVLTRKNKRAEYDKELEVAYRTGTIDTKEESVALETLAKAKQYFEKGQIKLAFQYIQEAVNSGVHDPSAYNIGAQCLYEMGDYIDSIQYLERGNELFRNNEDLEWLRVRYNIHMENFRGAQALINEKLNVNNKCSWAHAEQIYLYYFSGRKDMAFYAIDRYLQLNPHDLVFKQRTAYNLFSFAESLYELDRDSGTYVIATEKSYKQCLELAERAYTLWQDNYTSAELEGIRSFGELEYDTGNRMPMITYIALAVIGLFAGIYSGFIPSAVIGVIFGLLAFVIHKSSYVPVWRLYQELYTGVSYKLENPLYNIAMIPFDMAFSMMEGFI